MNRRMITGLLLVLSLSLVVGSLSLQTASAAILGTWHPSIKSVRGTSAGGIPFSGVIGAVATFEGTLQAYSVCGDPNVEEQVFLTSSDLSAFLESLNAELKAIYSSLDAEQQLAVIEVYSSLGSYLEQLAEEANQVFQDEGKSSATFEVQTVGEIAKNLPNQIWAGSALSGT